MVRDEHASRYIGILANRLRREIDALSFRGQYSGTEGKALHFILAHEDSELFQKDLEDEFGLRPPSASALVKKLEQDGLISRVPVSYDGRLKKSFPAKRHGRTGKRSCTMYRSLKTGCCKVSRSRSRHSGLRSQKR